MDSHQKVAIQAFKDRRSLCLLGSAGSGKSFAMQHIVGLANLAYGLYPIVTACAFTNAAAMSLGGNTIHRVFGALPSWNWSKERLWDLVKKNRRKRDELRSIRVLLIDEVSQIQSIQLDSIDFVLRKIPMSSVVEEDYEWLHQDSVLSAAPFGGRQVILSRDPFQLEPFASHNRKDATTFYQSSAWRLLFGGYGNGVVVNTDRNHRHSGDKQFFNILSRIRIGTQTLKDLEILNGTSKRSFSPKSYTVLCLKHSEVSKITYERQQELIAPFYTFSSVDDIPQTDQHSAITRRLSLSAPKHLNLKVGDLVLFTRHIEGHHAAQLLQSAKCHCNEPAYISER